MALHVTGQQCSDMNKVSLCDMSNKVGEKKKQAVQCAEIGTAQLSAGADLTLACIVKRYILPFRLVLTWAKTYIF